MTITKEILIELLNTSSKWDIIDFIINNHTNGYKEINDIYTECINKHGYDYRLAYKILGLTLNVGLIIFLMISKAQFTYLKYDLEFRMEQYKIQLKIHPNLTPEQFEANVTNTSALTDTLLEYLSIPLYMQSLFKHLFKTNAFQEEFNFRIATYIYEVLLKDPILYNTFIDMLNNNIL